MDRNGIYYAGDIHGVAEHVAEIDRKAIENNIEVVVQVGDFGCRFVAACPIVKYFEKRARQGRPGPTWYTCGGNHDNWPKWSEMAEAQGNPQIVELAPGCYFAPRGTTVALDGVKHLFFGGAESIDRAYRVEGEDWWAAESPTAEEFNKFFERMEADQPEVVVTHEAPLCVELNRPGRDSQPTPRNLQNVLKHNEHTPAYWYYGHHHCLNYDTIEGTTFACCGLHGQFILG
jgi:predicted MPP superfamily phosphohydrolase